MTLLDRTPEVEDFIELPPNIDREAVASLGTTALTDEGILLGMVDEHDVDRLGPVGTSRLLGFMTSLIGDTGVLKISQVSPDDPSIYLIAVPRERM